MCALARTVVADSSLGSGLAHGASLFVLAYGTHFGPDTSLQLSTRCHRNNDIGCAEHVATQANASEGAA